MHELLVPFIDIGRFLAAIGIIVGLGRGVALVMLAPLDNLLQNVFVDLRGRVLTENCIRMTAMGLAAGTAYVRNRDSLGDFTNILKHILDQNRTFSHGFLCKNEQRSSAWNANISGITRIK